MSKTAMKLALEALIGARAFLESDAPVEIWGVNDKAITALREALAEQSVQQEPYGWIGKDSGSFIKNVGQNKVTGKPLYTSPPAQRTWVGLTDEEIKPCWYEACQTDLELTSQLVVYFAKAIEAKLKDKNA